MKREKVELVLVNLGKHNTFSAELREKERKYYYTTSSVENSGAFILFRKPDLSCLFSSGFAAIMTCGGVEENCPFIPGIELRVGPG